MTSSLFDGFMKDEVKQGATTFFSVHKENSARSIMARKPFSTVRKPSYTGFDRREVILRELCVRGL